MELETEGGWGGPLYQNKSKSLHIDFQSPSLKIGGFFYFLWDWCGKWLNKCQLSKPKFLLEWPSKWPSKSKELNQVVPFIEKNSQTIVINFKDLVSKLWQFSNFFWIERVSDWVSARGKDHFISVLRKTAKPYLPIFRVKVSKFRKFSNFLAEWQSKWLIVW